MNTNQLKLIINAAEIADFEIDESKSISDNFNDAYQCMLEYARDNVDEFEIVVGELSNHYSHLYAQSKDGTEYEGDGQFINGNEEGGEIIDDFIDQEGNIVLVIYQDDVKRYMHVDTGSVEAEEEWVREIEEETDDLENFKEGTTAQEAFDEYVRDGKFIEVKKDVHGDWVEV